MVLVQVSCAVSRRQSLVAAHFFVLQSGSTAQGSLTPHLVLHSVRPPHRGFGVEPDSWDAAAVVAAAVGRRWR